MTTVPDLALPSGGHARGEAQVHGGRVEAGPPMIAGEHPRLLVLDDSDDDAELIRRAIRAGGIDARISHVRDEVAFRRALIDLGPEAILADFSMPGFSGTEAVAITRAWDPAVPCILVSGLLGEELAVTAIQSGATDYVLKHRLDLLPPALRRALDEAAERRERERLELELERFSSITTETFERMPIGLVVLDDAMRIVYANPAALRIGGQDLKVVTGQQFLDLYPEMAGTSFSAREGHLLAGSSIAFEDWFEPLGKWLDVMASGTDQGTTVFVRDVTDRHRAESALHESEALMHGSLDAMPDPFVVCSAVRSADGELQDFRIEFANDAAGVRLGRIATDLTGLAMSEALPDLFETTMFDGCRRVVETGEPWIEEAYPIRVGPNTERLFSMRIGRYRDGFLGVGRDVTEREQLRIERERLAAAVEQTTDGMLITDASGTVVYANPAFLSTVRRTGAEVVGRPSLPLAGEVLKRDQVVSIRRAARNAEPWLGEAERAQADGQMQRLEVSMAPVRGSDDAVTGYVIQMRDVTHLRDAEEELLLQQHIRDALNRSLHRLQPEAGLEQIAQAICDDLVGLPFIDMATVDVFLGPADLRVVGGVSPPKFPLRTGDRVPEERAAIIEHRLHDGPWAWYTTEDPGESDWSAEMKAAGLRATAYGPIMRGEDLIGVLVIGTLDEVFARTLVERMPGLVALGSTSSALLADRLWSMRREAELRASLLETIRTGAFRPVYQPIVDLQSGETYGYEALTRFASGVAPDRYFADAWSTGLGTELELATLAAAIESAVHLPAGRWLDLNVSPRLLESHDRLAQVLAACDRPIVLEITEHEIVSDYARLREAIRLLGGDLRLAVDDAGAGAANFGHIVELRPDFVKLDIGLVRNVNTDLGRQALVVGMRHFSRTAGCRLVAEGIETPEEAATMTGLGVEFGQGYALGRPAPASAWRPTPAAGAGEHRPARVKGSGGRSCAITRARG